MKDKCAGCRYSVSVDMGDGGEMLRACVYILRHGERRPCPPGADCTVYRPAAAPATERTGQFYNERMYSI